MLYFFQISIIVHELMPFFAPVKGQKQCESQDVYFLEKCDGLFNLVAFARN